MFKRLRRNTLLIEYILLALKVQWRGAVGHKGHMPLMNQIRGRHMSPLNLPLIKFEIVCFCP
jgi:hypothetical protein